MGKLFKSITLFVCLAATTLSYGQTKLYRSVVQGTPKIMGGLASATYTAAVLGYMVTVDGLDVKDIDNLLDDHISRWFCPSMEFEMHVPEWSLSDENGEIPMMAPRWWSFLLPDWKHNYKCSIGYELSWKSLLYPIGLYASINHEWQQIYIRDGLYSGKHKVSSFVPIAGIRLRLLGVGFEMDNNWNIVLDAGAAYVYRHKARNFYGWGKEAFSNGIRPRVGLAVSTIRYGTLFLRYEKDLFNFFNPDFVDENLPISLPKTENVFSSLTLGWTLLF